MRWTDLQRKGVKKLVVLRSLATLPIQASRRGPPGEDQYAICRRRVAAESAALHAIRANCTEHRTNVPRPTSPVRRPSPRPGFKFIVTAKFIVTMKAAVALAALLAAPGTVAFTSPRHVVSSAARGRHFVLSMGYGRS